MKNKIKHIIRYSIFIFLLLPTAVMAMEPLPDRDISEDRHIKVKVPRAYPTPPKITYDGYMRLCLGKKIGRWGNPTGDLAGWLQLPDNKQKLQDCGGELLDDLPLFQTTLSPIIEDNRLRCDYDLPIVDSDLTNGASTFSLYCDDVTDNEIKAVKKLKPESMLDCTTRMSQWQQMLKEQQNSRGVRSEILGKNLRLTEETISKKKNNRLLSLDHEYARNERMLSICNFDGTTGQLNSGFHIIREEKLLKDYETRMNDIQKEEKQNSYKKSLSENEVNTNIYFEDSVKLSGDIIFCANSLFDVKGSITMKYSLIVLERVYFRPVGSLFFQALSPTCSIDRIELTACNSSKPMIIYGKLNFNKESNINLECINVSRIDLQFRTVNQVLGDQECVKVGPVLEKSKKSKKYKDKKSKFSKK